MNPLPIWNERLEGIQIDNVKRTRLLNSKNEYHIILPQLHLLIHGKKLKIWLCLLNRGLCHTLVSTQNLNMMARSYDRQK